MKNNNFLNFIDLGKMILFAFLLFQFQANGQTFNIIAGNDGGTINGTTNVAVSNVLSNDTANGAPATTSNVILTQVSTTNPGVVLNTATGAVTVDPALGIGLYTLVYQICLTVNPAVCTQGTVFVSVNCNSNWPVWVLKDNLCLAAGTTSPTSILANDTINGMTATGSNVSINIIGGLPSGISINANGFVSIAPGTTPGTYSVNYQICNLCAPANCSAISGVANLTIHVYATSLLAVDDLVFSDNMGAIQGGSYNVLTNDRRLCAAFAPGSVLLTITTPSPDFTINTTPGPNFGAVIVNPGLTYGNYSLVYQICEPGNPSACSSATVTVVVALTLGSRANDLVRTSNFFPSTADVLITGNFTSYTSNGATVNRNQIAKLDYDNLGLNTTFGNGIANFGPSQPVATPYLIKAALTDANAVFVGGDFYEFNGVTKGRIAKLDSTTGALDATFSASFTSTVHDIKKQSANKIIVVGNFKYAHPLGGLRKGIVRLDATTGAIDPTFLASTGGSDGAINHVWVMADGSMIIGGNFSTYDGQTVNGIAKIDANGVLDTSTFNAGGTRFNITSAGNSRVIEQILVRGTKIYVVGFFGQYDGTAVGNIVKLNANGSRDTAFNNGTAGANFPVYSILSESRNLNSDNGTLLIGGSFTSYNVPLSIYYTPYLIRISNTGALNTTLVGNNGINGPASLYGTVFTMLRPSGSEIIFGGNFTTVNSIASGRITRINIDTGMHVREGAEAGLSEAAPLSVAIAPNPGKGLFSLRFDHPVADGTTISVYNMMGQKVMQNLVQDVAMHELDLTDFASGTYIVKISDDKQSLTKTIVKQ